MRRKPKAPNALPPGEDLGAEDSLEECLVSDLREVTDGYKRSGLTMAAVAGCVAVVLREEHDAMVYAYGRPEDQPDDGEEWKTA